MVRSMTQRTKTPTLLALNLFEFMVTEDAQSTTRTSICSSFPPDCLLNWNVQLQLGQIPLHTPRFPHTL